MFEQKGDELLSVPKFVGRLGASLLISAALVTVALLGGMAGYHYLAHLPWIDSVLNAAMILTGMGPVDPMTTNSAKLFATGYALFSGVVFLTSMGIVLAPVVHRIVHRFHLDDEEEDGTENGESGKAGKRKTGKTGK